MSRRRLIGIGIAVGLVFLAGAALAAWRGVVRLDQDATVPVYTVRRGEFVREVHAEGNLQATQATTLSPPRRVRGAMRIAWLAPDGTPVESGDVVVRFDPSDIEAMLEEGEVQRDTTDSRMTQKKVREEGASQNLSRDAEMAGLELDYAKEFQSKDPDVFSRNAIVEAEIDEELARERKEHAEDVRDLRQDLTRLDLDLLEIEKRQAQLKIDQARNDLSELEMRAPHDGIFTLKETWGGLPQVGMMIWPGNPIGEIPRLDEMEAKIFVLEADAGGLDVGIAGVVRLDAHPGREFRAKVRHVDALAQPRRRGHPVQYFGVILELDRTDTALMKPGQRVQATLTLERRTDAVTVPRQAVFERDGETVAYVRRGSAFEPVPLQLGPLGLAIQVVEDGLADGDVVALRDPTRRWEPGGSDEGEARPPNGAGL